MSWGLFFQEIFFAGDFFWVLCFLYSFSANALLVVASMKYHSLYVMLTEFFFQINVFPLLLCDIINRVLFIKRRAIQRVKNKLFLWENTLTRLLLISKSVRSRPGVGLWAQFYDFGSCVFHIRLSILVARPTTVRGWWREMVHCYRHARFPNGYRENACNLVFSFHPTSRSGLH